MSTPFPDNRGIPVNIGRAVKNGILIDKDSYFTYGPYNQPCPQMLIFNACRTVLGGPVKIKPDRTVLVNISKKRWKTRSDIYNGYMVVPVGFARLIAQYQNVAKGVNSLRVYAGMSLQEFLVRAWDHSGS